MDKHPPEYNFTSLLLLLDSCAIICPSSPHCRWPSTPGESTAWPSRWRARCTAGGRGTTASWATATRPPATAPGSSRRSGEGTLSASVAAAHTRPPSLLQVGERPPVTIFSLIYNTIADFKVHCMSTISAFCCIIPATYLCKADCNSAVVAAELKQ